MVVQHNLTAMNANRMLGITTGQQAKSSEKLSSGYRINRAADDAAGLTISEKMRKQIRGLDQASTNAQDGVSAVQTAEGALTEVHSMLQRMNELAVQASNGTNSESDRQAIQDEITQLTTEIDRVAETTKFNEIYLLKGDATGATTTKTLNAQDAGLKGTLVDNGDGTSAFELEKPLADGDKVTIAGKEYTIGAAPSSKDYAKVDSVTVGEIGDSVTSGGVTTTIVDKMTTAEAIGATWAADDTFVDADGKKWTVVDGDTDEAAGQVDITEVKKYLKAGSTITDNAALDIDSTDTDKLQNLKVVDTLAANEVSILDTDSIDALNDGLAVGDTVTAGGVTQTLTEEEPATLDELKAMLADGLTVKIGEDEYEIGIATDLDADTKTITSDDFLNLIKDGDIVDVDGNAYTAILKSAPNKITANEAYNKMADELAKASSIGTDTAATVKNNGNGKFTIKQGTVEVKSSLDFNLHVGADADMTNKINVSIDSMSAAGLGIKGLNVKDVTGMAATYAVDAIADAVATVSAQRSALGAVQNRLEHTIANLDNVVENTTAAESRIRDTDMAEEMVEYSKNNILAQAGQSMLAQANQSTQGVLSLLQ